MLNPSKIYGNQLENDLYEYAEESIMDLVDNIYSTNKARRSLTKQETGVNNSLYTTELLPSGLIVVHFCAT